MALGTEKSLAIAYRRAGFFQDEIGRQRYFAGERRCSSPLHSASLQWPRRRRLEQELGGLVRGRDPVDPHTVARDRGEEPAFDVQVEGVHIVNRKGKPIMRYGRVVSHRAASRKAYVKLAPGSKTLEFFEGI